MPLDGVAAELQLGAAREAAGGWRCTDPAPTGSPWSTTRTTPTPDSVRAALKALAVMGRGVDGGRGDRRGAARRTWAVLGEMGELGEVAGGCAELDALVAGRGLDLLLASVRTPTDGHGGAGGVLEGADARFGPVPTSAARPTCWLESRPAMSSWSRRPVA